MRHGSIGCQPLGIPEAASIFAAVAVVLPTVEYPDASTVLGIPATADPAIVATFSVVAEPSGSPRSALPG